MLVTSGAATCCGSEDPTCIGSAPTSALALADDDDAFDDDFNDDFDDDVPDFDDDEVLLCSGRVLDVALVRCFLEALPCPPDAVGATAGAGS